MFTRVHTENYSSPPIMREGTIWASHEVPFYDIQRTQVQLYYVDGVNYHSIILHF